MLKVQMLDMNLTYDEKGLSGDAILKNLAEYFILDYGPENGDPYKWLGRRFAEFYPEAKITATYDKSPPNVIN